MSLCIPCGTIVDSIKRNVSFALSNRYYVDDENKTYLPRVCACCDCLATIDNSMCPLPIEAVVRSLERCTTTRTEIEKYFPKEMLEYYQAKHKRLEKFLLSSRTRVFSLEPDKELVDVCKSCSKFFEDFHSNTRKKNFDGPPTAIFNGNMTGLPPSILTELNMAELAIISPNRILTHTVVLNCDNHDGIIGWHSMFENKTDVHLSNIQYLIDSGLEGEFVCVLCGPCTEIQMKKVKSTFVVRAEKVFRAFEWLKQNNIHFKDINIPRPEQMPHPTIIKHHSFEQVEEHIREIENEINITVLMPDQQSFNTTNGVFETQEEF